MAAARSRWILALALGLDALAGAAHAQSSDPADQVCQRFAPGSSLPSPADLRSQNGVLEVTLKFRTAVDAQGLTRYCYVTDSGLEAPTLHVYPGDQLLIHFQNDLPAVTGTSAQPTLRAHAHLANPDPNSDCSGGAMGPAVTNLHFHGLNVAPTCHQDEVINTLIQPAGTFDYAVEIPADEPTGLYWYHPHPHGFSSGQVLGGAAGALIVEGIENVNPLVAGLPQRLFVFRDQRIPGVYDPQGPSVDVSVNFVPVPAPTYTPPVVRTAPGVTEFWRALNASSDTLLQLQYRVDGVAQPLQVVALDGVPVGQGTGSIQAVSQTSIALPPGARAEFIAVTPKPGQSAQLITQTIDTGPDGARHPTRPLASIVAQSGTPPATARLGAVRNAVRTTRFASVSAAPPDGRRMLYFSESKGGGHPAYFITVQGQTPAEFDMSAPPSIVLHQGTTEEWLIENRSMEDHVFHIHQTRFQTLAINGQAVSDPALRDTITMPHWTGTGPYPSVKLRMDFRPANIVGSFVYHCHILSHEDLGMMAAIQVLPDGIATATTITATVSETLLNTPVTFTANVAPATAGTALGGSVQFFDNQVPVGNPVAISGTHAVLTTQLSSYGKHVVSAMYSGDSTRNQSLAAGVTVAAEDFGLSASALTVKWGQSGSAPIAVTASNGFAGVVNFSCALPDTLAGASCELSPASLGGAGTISLSVKTSSASAASIATGTSAALAALFLAVLPLRRRQREFFTAAMLCTLAILAGCGGAHDASSGSHAGNYTVTVTGSCGDDAAPIVHSVAVALQVVD